MTQIAVSKPLSKNVRVMYLRDRTFNPIGCVVVKVQPGALNGTPATFEYDFSVMNPLDRFNRAFARNVAEGRLEKSANASSAFFAATSGHDIMAGVMKHLSDNPHAPTRAKKAAKLWLSYSFPKSEQELTQEEKDRRLLQNDGDCLRWVQLTKKSMLRQQSNLEVAKPTPKKAAKTKKDVEPVKPTKAAKAEKPEKVDKPTKVKKPVKVVKTAPLRKQNKYN